MSRLSERLGLAPARTKLQTDGLDDRTRSRLWNEFYRVLIAPIYLSPYGGTLYSHRGPECLFFEMLWDEHFGVPVDTLPRLADQLRQKLNSFFHESSWLDVLDFVDFTGQHAGYRDGFNRILEVELVGYRFVGKILTPLTDPEQIKEINAALGVSAVKVGLRGANEHLQTSLALFSDRTKPDYRNSIKEAISAVEMVARAINGNAATLGAALKVLSNKVEIHPALQLGFDKIYGYTSDADGIRHALMDESNLGPEDARYYLVACSAFVNYLVVKADKAGIAL